MKRRNSRPKTVSFHQVHAISDNLVNYKNKMYLAKEDLKKFPLKVTLIPLPRQQYRDTDKPIYDAFEDKTYLPWDQGYKEKKKLLR